MNRFEFCALLSKEREKKGLSLYSIQKKMGLTFQQVKRIETGENNFNVEKAIEFINAMESTIVLITSDNRYLVNEYSFLVDVLIKLRDGQYSQRALAEAVHCSYISIANTESGKSVISIDLLLKILSVFNVTIYLQ